LSIADFRLLIDIGRNCCTTLSIGNRQSEIKTWSSVAAEGRAASGSRPSRFGMLPFGDFDAILRAV
jgi:hypothetical protein